MQWMGLREQEGIVETSTPCLLIPDLHEQRRDHVFTCDGTETSLDADEKQS